MSQVNQRVKAALNSNNSHNGAFIGMRGDFSQYQNGTKTPKVPVRRVMSAREV